MSVPICNCFHTTRTNSGKITTFYVQQQNDPRILAMAWKSVRLYVHHTLALYQNSDTKNRELFNVGCLKVSSFS